MSKLTLTEAVKVIPVSESTLRRDMKSWKVSFETDEKGRKWIDLSELTRVYGQLTEAEPSILIRCFLRFFLLHGFFRCIIAL